MAVSSVEIQEQLNRLITSTVDNNTDLPTQVICDNLNTESLGSLVERIQEELKRKEILREHKTPIKQLPNGRWYTRLGGKKIERTSMREMENAIVSYYRLEKITVNNIFPDFLERSKATVSKSTWAKYILYFNTFIFTSELGHKPIASLRISDGYDFLNHCIKIMPDMKRKYWNNVKALLNQIFQYSIDNEYITTNPFVHLKPKKDFFTASPKVRDGDSIFTKEEQRNVCLSAEKDSIERTSAIPLGIIVLFNLGLRCGELCALKWSDIEKSAIREYIHIQREMVVSIDEKGKCDGFEVLPHCKTPAGDRRLQLNNKVIEIFDRIRELNIKNGLPTGQEDYIFLRKNKKEALTCTPRSFAPRLDKYCKENQMRVSKSPHDIRRTVLTNLYIAGMPLKKIQEFAGHSSLKQTMDYIRISDDEQDLTDYLNALSS